jgi:hypothetical protein
VIFVQLLTGHRAERTARELLIAGHDPEIAPGMAGSGGAGAILESGTEG